MSVLLKEKIIAIICLRIKDDFVRILALALEISMTVSSLKRLYDNAFRWPLLYGAQWLSSGVFDLRTTCPCHSSHTGGTVLCPTTYRLVLPGSNQENVSTCMMAEKKCWLDSKASTQTANF